MEKINKVLNNETFDDDKDYAKELYKKFINDDELYKEAIDDGFSNEEIYNHIGLFNDLKENRDIDRRITSLNDCYYYNHFFYFKIIRNGISFDKVYSANKYYAEFLKYSSRFIYKDFDDAFDNIKMKSIDNKRAGKLIQNCYKNRYWIYLYGPFRSGKTYLAISFVNSIIEHENYKVAFINTIARFDELIGLYFKNRNEFYEKIEGLKKVDLLVLDNFGSEYKNNYIRDLILKPILIYRSQFDNLITVFTSQYRYNDVIKMYEFNQNNNNSNLGVSELIYLFSSKVKEEIVVSTLQKY